jgi:uncharacterized protein
MVAACNLGVCLAEGLGVELDEPQAATWLRRAAGGVVDAQYHYGRMLVDGRGVEANATAGRAWIARAAGAGMANAQAALAEMMVNGRGGPCDPLTAVVLFEKAARKGHVGAMFALGVLNGGHHGRANHTIAQRWLQAAADRGHGHAQMMLGSHRERGQRGGG